MCSTSLIRSAGPVTDSPGETEERLSDVQIITAGAAEDIFNLNDDLVKLVVYSIISIRRDHERFMDMGTGQVVVTDRMTGEDFINWKIAEYLQKPGKNYVPADNQYLRIHYAVVRRWPREPIRFEERQVEAIREISNNLK
jgi:hypothetical protein